MTKQEYMAHIIALYRAANMADSGKAPAWMKPVMAGQAGCAALDTMLHEMVKAGVLTAEELQAFHDNL